MATNATAGGKKTLALMMSAGLAVWCVAGGVARAQDGAAEKTPAAEQATEERPLQIGDNAPPLAIKAWLKGTPVEGFKPGQVYVVEFWATWCGPCLKTIPHLTELQKRFGDSVRVIGVSIWEEDGALEPTVRPFVDSMGDKMNYSVAFGGDNAPMAKTWMEASGQSGIPAAFVVDKAGKIAWMGHPAADMDKVIEQVVNGTWDTKAAGEKAAAERALAVKARTLSNRWMEARDSGNKSEALRIGKEMVETAPQYFDRIAIWVFETMLVEGNDAPGAYAYARKLVSGVYADNPMVQNGISWTILGNEGVKTRDLDLALETAQRASTLTDNKQPILLDTLARAQFLKGDAAAALATQQRALELHEATVKEAAEKNPGVAIPRAKETGADLRKRLAEYEAAAQKK